jgi:dTDP-4-dehydrorhamnose reductase
VKILVTGKHGQLALSLAEQAAGGRHALIFAGRPELDLEHPGKVRAAIIAARPDVVVNAAAFTEVDRAEDEPALAKRINAGAAHEAAAASVEVGARFIQLSTDYVFDGQGDTAYREDDLTGPLSVYGQTKLAGEDQVRLADPDSVIVRTAWVYSAFGKNFVKSIMAAAAAGRDPLRVVGDQTGSPTSAGDLADGLLALVDRWPSGDAVGLGRTYHVAGTGEASWCDLAERVMAGCRDAGLPWSRVEPIPTADWPTRAPRPANSRLDSGLFAAEVGYRAPRWEQSVDAVVKRLARS